ncbi:MAG: multi-sensor hybrid histidine kinase [Chlamydiales bacterium]|nr:multi-sensor hybrid histidine kinase [Chlamydiales bacterium]
MQFSIADTGPGIPEEYQEKIFQKYVRLRTKEAHKGYGLGLVICRELTEIFQGELTVENNPDQGATFRLTLPLNKDLLSETGAIHLEPFSRCCTKVLYVDDSPFMRKLGTKKLEKLGLGVDSVAGKEGLFSKLSQNSYDLILMDFYLEALEEKKEPLTGLELTQELRQQGYQMPVIICSSSPIPPAIVRAAGADGSIVKTASMGELSQLLQEFLPENQGEKLHLCQTKVEL